MTSLTSHRPIVGRTTVEVERPGDALGGGWSRPIRDWPGLRGVIIRSIILASVVGSILGAVPRQTSGQGFEPPDEQRDVDTAAGLRFGFYGFSSRVGYDFASGGEALLAVSLDAGHVVTDRLRLRPTAEIGFGGEVDTYVVSAEIVYRFTDDAELAIPYVGAGFGVYGQDGCALDESCPDAWLQFALGFEIQLHEGLNWMLEYHGEDALRRHRLFIGLASRRRP